MKKWESWKVGVAGVFVWMAFSFWWKEIRPAEIAKECRNEAETVYNIFLEQSLDKSIAVRPKNLLGAYDIFFGKCMARHAVFDKRFYKDPRPLP